MEDQVEACYVDDNEECGGEQGQPAQSTLPVKEKQSEQVCQQQQADVGYLQEMRSGFGLSAIRMLRRHVLA
ncbi:MAG TPA: hypothetical protein VL051_08990 [Burkholderiaceae bacterium]|nr:hypothetical protein [Burkholderiaceae bacterium]